MADIEVKIPKSLGLSDDQLNRLEQSFQNQIVEAMTGSKAESLVVARPQTVQVPQVVSIRKSQVVDV